MSKNRSRGTKVSAFSRRRRESRPGVETLELRQMLSTVNWISATSGSWDTASNWSTDAVPGAGDDVVINVTGATPTVTISSNLESVKSITADDPLAISGGGLTVAAKSTISGGLAMTGGSLTANGSGVSLTVTGTTTVSVANLYAEGGATLSLPQLTSYSGGGSFVGSTLQASGAGSVLSLPALATIAASTAFDSSVQVGPSSGGDVELPILTEVTGPLQFAISTGSGTLNLSRLATFTGGTLNDSGGDLKMPVLADADGTAFLIGGGVTMTLSALTEADVANFDVSGGSSLTVPALVSYSGGGGFVTSTLQASGVGSVLSLPALATITASTAFDSSVQVGPSSGGDVEFPLLTQVSGPLEFAISAGSGTLNLSRLATFTGGTLNDSGGNLKMPALADADSTTFLIAGGVTMTLSALTEADVANFDVSGGSSLTVPALASYSGGGGFVSSTLQASGAGSVLSLPALATITAAPAFDSSVQVGPLSGGDVKLPKLTELGGPVNLVSENAGSTLDLSGPTSLSGGSLTVTSQGTLKDPNLVTVDGVGITLDGTGTLATTQWATLVGSSLTITGGAYTFAGLTDIGLSSIQLSGGATLSLPAVAQGTLPLSNGQSVTVRGTLVSVPAAGTADATINVPQSSGLTLTMQNSGTLTATTFNVGQGTTLDLTGGTYSGGAVFNVAQGAVVDLTGGQTVTYSGTLTGSGSGTVQFTTGTMTVGVGGLTLDFPGSMFQWTGGGLEASGGNVTNQGTINLSGSNETQIYADGALDDYGTIIQTGTGDFGLHSDTVSPSTLMIEPGGLYEIESNAGVNNLVNSNVIDNAGTIEKTTGTGTSTLAVNGPFINTGTIEVQSGTLLLEPTSFSQLSGDALTGGTWNALNGSTLAFPSGTSIATNQANITLDGHGATIAALSGLTSNPGNLSLTNGASLSTAGNFSDTGSLTLGAGSMLTVNRSYTQGSSATLAVDIGGSSVSGQFGQLAITGSAALAGTVNITFINGYSPTAGDNYPITTYTSETGGSSLTFTGLSGGAFSFIQPVVNATAIDLTSTTSAADLSVEPFSVPVNGTVGQNISIAYQVQNLSSNAATGDWFDSFFLSTTTSLNSSSLLLGTVEHTGGLAAQGSYNGSLTAALPGVAPGQYYVIAEIDSKGLVPDVNRANNVAASSNPINVAVPSATLGQAVSGTINDGQDVYYQITVPAGQDLAIDASFATLQGGELYVGYQSVPTTSTYLASSTSATQIAQQVVIPDTQAGTYYILVQGDTGSTGGKPFKLATESLPLQVTGVSPETAGNFGTTTLTIEGAEFTSGASVKLVPHGGGTSIAASAVTFQGSTTLFAQFNLGGAAAGNYDVVVSDGAKKATEPSAFAVTTNANPGHISYNLSVPSVSRPGRIAYLTLTYSNDGGSNALAPLFVVSVTSGNATIGLPGETSFSGSSVQVLGIENSGPAGTLPPGFQGTLLIPYESTTLTQGASINFSLQVLTGDSTPMNWSSLESSLQPSYIPNSAWPAVFANLTAEFGSTTASYLGALDNEATYLSQLGEYTNDVQRLFGFAINTANDALTTGSIDSVTDASFPVPGAIPLEFDRQFNASISGRETIGPFGLGWTDNWQISASADSAGNVTIADDGSLLFFTKNSDGSYTDAPGEYGTLTLTSGAYQYVETDGTLLAFNTNGTLNYEQDTNGNRITTGYNSGGELASLTASNGSAITIAYNTQGLIKSITEPGNQTTQYTYDASGQHLLTFTDQFGMTTYTYATGPAAADANALASLTFADGTGLEWTYDVEGRIATAGRLGGAETETYAYPGPGEDTVTDADGNMTTVFHDDLGDVGETIDLLGNITRNTYDANHNLVKTVAADGTATTFAYDQNGNMTSETDALGYSIFFTYNSLAEPLTFVNQQGYTTRYYYDASGNLLETLNPDSTTQHYAYNALGEVTSSTDPNGQLITYTYNTNAQLATETLPKGTSTSYTYDSLGNMKTADSPSGDWSFAYNSQNLPTTITEPYGSLTVRYGLDGNITQIVDQTGFTTNYVYDTVGRLSELTDANDDLIESYAYDPAGNIVSETKGNGTSTTYRYNRDGAVTEITSLAPGGAINSQMTYTYGAVGQVATMTTGGVTTTYGYDADGELASASSSEGTILYAYDPDGNRTSVTDNGVVTDYTSNSVNEYTQVGDTSYQYDANGNLIAATTNGQTTTYAFNALNQLTGVSGSVGTYSYSYDALKATRISLDRQRPDDEQPDRSVRAGERRGAVRQFGELDRPFHLRPGAGQPGHRERSGVLLRLQPPGLDGWDHEFSGGLRQPVQL